VRTERVNKRKETEEKMERTERRDEGERERERESAYRQETQVAEFGERAGGGRKRDRERRGEREGEEKKVRDSKGASIKIYDTISKDPAIILLIMKLRMELVVNG
jgi:hypothetical protein